MWGEDYCDVYRGLGDAFLTEVAAGVVFDANAIPCGLVTSLLAQPHLSNVDPAAAAEVFGVVHQHILCLHLSRKYVGNKPTYPAHPRRCKEDE